jgi:hypothetical protein
VILLSCGCSVLRKDGMKNYNDQNGDVSKNIIQNVEKQNLTAKGFYIEKAEIEIINQEGSEKYLSSIKFESPDKYLISLKSRTGIEAARIYISRDTIFINDRINKKYFHGSPEYLNLKYGVSIFFIPVILGDFISDDSTKGNNTDCAQGKRKFDGRIKGLRINYIVDCWKNKIVESGIENSLNRNSFLIDYSNFGKRGDIIIPLNIRVIDNNRNATISLKIEKILVPWDGAIEFSPGKNYESLQLL